MAKKQPHIAFIRTNMDASSYYRIYLPYLGLKEKGYNVSLDTPFQELPGADVIVFRREYADLTADEIYWLKDRGTKILLDFDDNYFALDLTNPVKFAWNETALQDMTAMLSVADVVTTTVQPLAESYSRCNKNVVVVPNAVNETALAFERRNADNLIIGWQGSPSHQEDLRLVKSLINDLQRKHKFDFVTAGYEPPGFFKNNTYREWRQFSYDLSHQVQFNDFDIGICPLQKTLFNEAKSDLKFLEYSSLGIATVATDMVTYETIKQGETGYLARNLSEWEKCLTELIEDEEKRIKMAKAAKEYVASERTIQKTVHLWEEVLQNL